MTIAAFDFDGTVTRHDSMWMFLRHVSGNNIKFTAWALLVSPVLVFALFSRKNRRACKQKLFKRFFKGKSTEQMQQLCLSFADVIESDLKSGTLDKIESHQKNGDKIVIVSASLEMWIKPWASRRGIEVIATKSDGWKLLSPNCNYKEKPRRFLEKYPDRDGYKLYVYGDSDGDRDLMAIADDAQFL